MKKILMLFMFCMSIPIAQNSYAVENTSILGLWYMHKDKEGYTPVAEVFEKNGRYYAYAFAFKDLTSTPGKDTENPDKSLQTRSLNGLVFVYDLSFHDGKWINGEIYNPDAGKYFYLKGSLSKDEKELTWKASIDKSGMFGKNLIWTRVEPTELPKYNSLKPERSVIELNIPTKRHKQ